MTIIKSQWLIFGETLILWTPDELTNKFKIQIKSWASSHFYTGRYCRDNDCVLNDISTVVEFQWLKGSYLNSWSEESKLSDWSLPNTVFVLQYGKQRCHIFVLLEGFFRIPIHSSTILMTRQTHTPNINVLSCLIKVWVWVWTGSQNKDKEPLYVTCTK